MSLFVERDVTVGRIQIPVVKTKIETFTTPTMNHATASLVLYKITHKGFRKTDVTSMSSPLIPLRIKVSEVIPVTPLLKTSVSS